MAKPQTRRTGTGNNNVNRFPDQGHETSYDNERREQNRTQSRENPARDLRPPPQNSSTLFEVFTGLASNDVARAV